MLVVTKDAEILEADGEFYGRKWVRIMCDFAADGVWNIAGESICADSLPVDDALLDRIGRWQLNYDERADEADSPTPSFDLQAHDAEGLAIAHAVKAQLPEWTVIFFEEAKARSATARRSNFEYEIFL